MLTDYNERRERYCSLQVLKPRASYRQPCLKAVCRRPMYRYRLVQIPERGVHCAANIMLRPTSAIVPHQSLVVKVHLQANAKLQ
jgi:hypothetical protein